MSSRQLRLTGLQAPATDNLAMPPVVMMPRKLTRRSDSVDRHAATVERISVGRQTLFRHPVE